MSASSKSNISRRGFMAGCLGSAAATMGAGLPRAAPAAAGGALAQNIVLRPPNIVFILADDIGYGDLGCYGAFKVKTPNLDRLAAAGVRFTDAHSPSSMCTPTRYAFMTGRYAWRNPATARGVLSGVAPLSIQPGTCTAPALLKQAGYATGIVGKWHLGLGEGTTDYNREIRPGPLEVGFDYAFILPATGDRVPCVYVENRRVVGLDPKDPIACDYSVARGAPESFVLGVPRIGKMTGGKAALWNDENMAATFAAKAAAFIEQHRERPFFLYFCTHDIHVPRVPNARFKGTSQAGVRGDTIHSLDWTVGEVLAALDRLKLADNTLVIFSSDNGGVLDPNGPDVEHGGTVETNNGHLFNGPLSGTKGGLIEGGHRVPFIARWPGRIKAGGVSKQMISLVDLLATFAAVTGAALPPEAGPDSINVLPALLDASLAEPVRKDLVMHSGAGALAIREGDWKLIPAGGQGQPAKKKGAAGGALYNLAQDLGEQKNLYAEHPEIVKRLADLLEKYRTEGRSRGV